MKKRSFCLLLACAVMMSLLENSTAMHESKVEEKPWKPAEEPRDKAEAEKLQIEAQKEEKRAENELKEAKTDEERAKKEAIIEKARYDQDTAQKRINFETLKENKADPELEKIAEKELNERKEEIKKKIQEYQNALASGGQSTGGGVITDPAKQYEKAFNDKLATIAGNDAELLNFLTRELNLLDSGRSGLGGELRGKTLDYSIRRDALKLIEDAINRHSGGGEQFTALKERTRDTIAQIDQLKNNPQKAITGNKIDQQLKLSEKIYSDQVNALKKELTETTFKKKYTTAKERVDALNELQQIVDLTV